MGIIKKLVCVTILVLSASAAVPASAADIRVFGPEVPFPFGTEVPFPWDTIEGVWQAKDEVVDTMFSFEVRADGCDGTRLLKVRHYDQDTKKIVAQGFGTSFADERVIRAIMKGDGYNYIVVVRAYIDRTQDNKRATVLTVRSLENPQDESHFVLKKVSRVPLK